MQNKTRSILAFVALAMCMFAASAEVIVPKPAAVWDGDFSTTIDGFALDAQYESMASDYSTVTITHDDTGLLVDFANGKSYRSITVLVKYANFVRDEIKTNVLFAATRNAKHEFNTYGVWLRPDGDIAGFYNHANNGNDNREEIGTAEPLNIPSNGIIAFVCRSDDKMSAYVSGATDMFSEDVSWKASNLAELTCGIAVGGQCKGAFTLGAQAAQGMTISGLAVFTNVLTVAQMNAYRWPNSDETVESILAKQLDADALAKLGVDLEEGETTAEALAKPWDNKLTAWQNIILGISKADANAGKMPFVAPVQNSCPDALSFTVGRCAASNNLSGVKAKYTVYEVDENGEEIETDDGLVSEETDLGEFATIPTAGIDGVKYFKIRITFSRDTVGE